VQGHAAQLQGQDNNQHNAVSKSNRYWWLLCNSSSEPDRGEALNRADMCP
jgi:hypothetical protein